MTTQFDAFLSHNSQDKPQVEQIAIWLQAQNLKVLFDKWELRPGMIWPEKLQEGLQQSRVIIVFIGEHGRGPWHDQEMRAALWKSVKHDCPVIPVLLPGCPEKPEIPPFLEIRTRVDLRKGLDDDAAKEELLCGITGQKPAEMPIGATPGQPKPFVTRRNFIVSGVSLMLVIAMFLLLLFSGVFTPKQPLPGVFWIKTGIPYPAWS
jgi:hypothetical protein